MASFGGSSGATAVKAAIEDDPRTNSRADRRVEDVLVAAAGTPQSFRQSGGIGVVVYLHGYAIPARDLGGQRKITPARQIGWIDNHTGMGIQRTRRTDTNPSNRIEQ